MLFQHFKGVIFRGYTWTLNTLLLLCFSYIVSTAALINMKPDFMNEYNYGYQSQADCVVVLQLNKIKENQQASCLHGALTTF